MNSVSLIDSLVRSSDPLLLLDLVLLCYVFQGILPFHLSNKYYHKVFLFKKIKKKKFSFFL